MPRFNLLARGMPDPVQTEVFPMTHKLFRLATRKLALAVASLGLLAGAASTASAQDTVKIGVLHSLSGTMAISETSLRDVVLMASDEINAAGGVKVAGKAYKIQPVVVDPASDWPLFAEKAKQLITQDKVAATFGCWTSVSRKSCLPVFKSTTRCCSILCSMRVKSSR
jgi:urea transport system substrate-binding protein